MELCRALYFIPRQAMSSPNSTAAVALRVPRGECGWTPLRVYSGIGGLLGLPSKVGLLSTPGSVVFPPSDTGPPYSFLHHWSGISEIIVSDIEYPEFLCSSQLCIFRYV